MANRMSRRHHRQQYAVLCRFDIHEAKRAKMRNEIGKKGGFDEYGVTADDAITERQTNGSGKIYIVIII